MMKHIDAVMASCARTLYGLELRTLRAHGYTTMPQASLQYSLSNNRIDIETQRLLSTAFNSRVSVNVVNQD